MPLTPHFEHGTLNKVIKRKRIVMRKKVVLACTVCNGRNYTTDKKQQSAERIEVKKYCKRCGEHTLHRETK